MPSSSVMGVSCINFEILHGTGSYIDGNRELEITNS